ncbi:hypothetical protein [Idiomarina abyssalis]|uniref:Uncharacterized protein n=1 Tax=Idiomarina abyssalis TaxID=86102 RepID=A0A8I1G6S8_9GAMM|nr:hypothetical protein [Idiomarina abyssalis]MBJ7265502.1 hypothetical protein [Idiomarina abyssalis]MBJ7316824.1 hypothetical protein [Idiomarina abyssalis]
MSELTNTQQAFINSLQPELRQKAIDTLNRGGYFYADVIPTMTGPSVASCGVKGIQDAFPDLHLTFTGAQAESKECALDYERDIEAGERDEDDVYEGVVMAIQWRSDDTLRFFDLHIGDEILPIPVAISEKPVTQAMGL